MKKTAIVIASVILFVVLLGVNYLLWDNSSKKQDIESLENKDETTQQTFQNLYDEIYANRQTINDLNKQITDLEAIIAEKDQDIALLEEENLNRWNVVGDKNTIIQQLKSHSDTDYYKGILDEWVSSINDREYFSAYIQQNEANVFNDRAEIPYQNYDDIFENVISMEILEFKVRVMDDGEVLDQDAQNRITFNVVMNIELVKDEEGFPINDAIFNSNLNYFEVTMAFDRVSWKWFLWTIE